MVNKTLFTRAQSDGCLVEMFLALACLLIGVGGQKVKFDGYQLLRAFPNSNAQVNALRDLELAGEFDFWTSVGRINGSVDVLVPPQRKTYFQQFLNDHDISHICQIEDVQSLIDEQESRASSRCIDMDWKNYHKLQEIYDWMDEIAKKYSFVKKFSPGKSHEGRKIKGVEISFGGNTTGVFIESGMHGREWITPAATTWMIDQILQKIDSHEDTVFKNFSYFYVPVVNPDGYAYTWTHNRLWKKTRTLYKNRTTVCYGADPNRNWDISWKAFKQSEDPCSESYPGPSAFSELETKSISNHLKCIARSRNVDIYIAYRSYGQRLHYPRNHDRSPALQQQLWQRIGELAADDLRKVHGTPFEVGSFSHFYEPAAGTSVDWYYELYDSTISYTYELRDTGGYGFLLPSDQIIPTGEELLPSLERVLIEYQRLNVTHPED